MKYKPCTSNGALQVHYAEAVKIKYPVNARYGKLVVAGYRRESDGWSVVCSCDCGGTKVIRRPNQMRRGLIPSCGCLRWKKKSSRKTYVKKGRKHLAAGEAIFNVLFYSYARGARKRGLTFNISRELFRDLTSRNCEYCGVPPSNVRTGKGYFGAYTYNGVDRIDSSVGYESSNVAPCCKECQRAKGTMTRHGFIALAKRIAANN